jgi:hypothetical protein
MILHIWTWSFTHLMCTWADNIVMGAERAADHIIWPAHTSCNVWTIPEATHFMLKARVMWELSKTWRTGDMPLKVAVKSSWGPFQFSEVQNRRVSSETVGQLVSKPVSHLVSQSGSEWVVHRITVQCSAEKTREEVSAVSDQLHCRAVMSEQRTGLSSLSGYGLWDRNCSTWQESLQY